MLESCKNRPGEEHTCQSPWVLQPRGQGNTPSRSMLALYIFANISPALKQLNLNGKRVRTLYRDLSRVPLHDRRTARHQHYIPSENYFAFLPIPRISALSAHDADCPPDAAVPLHQGLPLSAWLDPGREKGINQMRLSELAILGLWLSPIVQFNSAISMGCLH